MSAEHREIDPVTGHETTGHDWNGIRELNTPFPRVVIWALVLTFLYSLVAWVLLPAWPLGRDATRGLLGLDQGTQAVTGFRALDGARQGWLAPFAGDDFATLAADRGLMRAALPAAARLFADNCAACHGEGGGGGPGFPSLRSGDWLWGGEPEAIAETIRFGINSAHPETRIAEMPAFDWMSREELQALAGHVATLPGGAADPNSDSAMLFEENCAACHGEAGTGGLATGAPALADAAVIYGQDVATVLRTLRHGRAGVMPAWADRLGAAEINLLALYVAGLAEAAP